MRDLVCMRGVFGVNKVPGENLARTVLCRLTRAHTGLFIASLIACLFGATGCAVPQPRGVGELTRIVEPSSSRGYWRYLPRDYTRMSDGDRRSRRWPLVVTFHGMKPFDNAHPQACEWQQEADRYGMIVIAPELDAPDVLRQFPVRTVSAAFAGDEEATLKILDHVFATTRGDPSNVLSTSWSSGGYMAHYMLNRHPDRFTCLAVRQSNFSAAVLDGEMAKRSVRHPILIVNTENDFAVCLRESNEARDWYTSHRYENFAWVHIRSLGHERTPDLAADFFARVAQVEPTTPPTVLVERQAIDGNADGIALLMGRGDTRQLAERQNRARSDVRAQAPISAPPIAADDPSLTPRRSGAIPTARAPRRDPVSIRVSPAIGVEPLQFTFSAECPSAWYNSAKFSWTLGGTLIADGASGQRTISDPGEHTLTLTVATDDNQTHTASRTIRVIPRAAATASKN